MLLRYDDCPLYCMQSKKQLRYLLKIKDKRLLKQDYVASLIEPYIKTSGKPRLIEPPREDLKSIQKRIKNALGKIEVPKNVFSGIKGRSYIDNALFHNGLQPRYMYKVDLTAFFPSISRETVYGFFRNELRCSPDIAMILSNFTTIDLTKANLKDPSSVYDFLSAKGIKSNNHLLSGAPTSQILSYLVNHEMFNEMQALADKHLVVMTIYVDDITFSSTHKISHRFQEQILRIIKKYKYQVSRKKVKYYTKMYPKLITGVILSANGKVAIKNSLRKKIIADHKCLRNNPNDLMSRKRLQGLVTAARQIQKDAYPSIYTFAFEKSKKYKKEAQPNI